MMAEKKPKEKDEEFHKALEILAWPQNRSLGELDNARLVVQQQLEK